MNLNFKQIQIGDVVSEIYFDTTKDLKNLNIDTTKIHIQFSNNDYIKYIKQGTSYELVYYKNDIYSHTFYSYDELFDLIDEDTYWLKEKHIFDEPVTIVNIDSEFDNISCIYTEYINNINDEEHSLYTTKPTIPSTDQSLNTIINKVNEVSNYTENLRTKLISNINTLSDVLYQEPPSIIQVTVSKLTYRINGSQFVFKKITTGEIIYTHTFSGIEGYNVTQNFVVTTTDPCQITFISNGTQSQVNINLYINTVLSSNMESNNAWGSYEETFTSTINPGDTIEISVDNYSCLAKGTKITLADNTYKNIEDITYDDEILVWNFDEGKFDSAKPLWIKKAESCPRYNLLKFSDGSELKTIDQHRIFNKQKGMFTYPMTDDTPIGTITFNEKCEEVTLISKEVVSEEVEYYNVITNHHINLFGNSILTSCRYNNIYPVENMKFIKDDRVLSIDSYDNEIPCKYINGLRLSEQNYSKEENIKYIRNLIRLKK